MNDSTLEGAVPGTVKWFDPAKGYGFVETDEYDEDVFVHQTAIVMAGFRTLDTDQHVEVVVEPSEKGLQASECHPQ